MWPQSLLSYSPLPSSESPVDTVEAVPVTEAIVPLLSVLSFVKLVLRDQINVKI